MVTKRRSKLEILLEVLKVIKNGKYKPTNIMYAANLSWKPTQQALESLIMQGLITTKDSSGRDERTKVIYEITQKGKDVVRHFHDMGGKIKT